MAALALAMPLVACSTSAGDGHQVHLDATYRGTALPQRNASSSDLRPTAYWVSGRHDVALTAWGSSGCPPVPDRIDVRSKVAVDVHLKDYGSTACTADLAATTTELALPGSVSRGRTVAVTVQARGFSDTVLHLAPQPLVASHRH